MPKKQQYKDPPESLRKLLDDHLRWLEGKGGSQLTDEKCRWKFKNLRLDGVSFRKAKLHFVDFYKCSLARADFTLASLDSSRYLSCDLKGALYHQADLSRCTFDAGNTNLKPESFRGATLHLADIPSITTPRSDDDLAACILSAPVPKR